MAKQNTCTHYQLRPSGGGPNNTPTSSNDNFASTHGAVAKSKGILAKIKIGHKISSAKHALRLPSYLCGVRHATGMLIIANAMFILQLPFCACHNRMLALMLPYSSLTRYCTLNAIPINHFNNFQHTCCMWSMPCPDGAPAAPPG